MDPSQQQQQAINNIQQGGILDNAVNPPPVNNNNDVNNNNPGPGANININNPPPQPPQNINEQANVINAEQNQQQTQLQGVDVLQKLIPKPEYFRGKRNENVVLWLEKLKMYFITCNITNEDVRLKIAVQYLTDDALYWYISVNNYGQTIDTFTELWNGLLDMYRDTTAEAKAFDKLASVKQTSDVPSYIAYFNKVIVQLGGKVDNESLKRYFIRGLREDIRVPVALQYPISLSHAMQLASTIAQTRYSAINSNNYSQQLNSIVQNDNIVSGNTEQELNAINKRSNNNNKKKEYKPKPKSKFKKLSDQGLSAEQIKYRKDNKLCYKCGNVGHSVKDCNRQVFQ